MESVKIFATSVHSTRQGTFHSEKHIDFWKLWIPKNKSILLFAESATCHCVVLAAMRKFHGCGCLLSDFKKYFLASFSSEKQLI